MYNTKELNTMLLEAFPELKERFEDETSWDDGIETGSYVVYEDIFMPHVVQALLIMIRNQLIELCSLWKSWHPVMMSM